MKKHVLLVILHLLFCSIVFGQTDDPGCNTTVQGSSGGCAHATNCVGTDGCTAVYFSVDCGGTYQLRAWTKCGNTNCFYCVSCVSIFTDSPAVTPVATVSTLNVCDNPDCDESTTTTSITAGNYIMYVCKIPCTENDQEVCCSTDSGCAA